MKKPISIMMSVALVGSMAALPVQAAGLDLFKPSYSYQEGQFIDVAQKDWYASDVVSAFELGLMKGTGDNAFSPSAPFTYASALALASRLHAVYHDGADTAFDQTSGNHWYDTYVEYATKQGILTGVENVNYDAPATRTEFAALLNAALPKEAFEVKNEVADNAIPDVSMEDDHAEAVYALYRAGIFTGSDQDHTFLPGESISRAQVAAAASRTANPELRQSVSLPGAAEKPETPAPSEKPEAPAPSEKPETPAPSEKPEAPSPSEKPEAPVPSDKPEAPETPENGGSENSGTATQVNAVLALVNEARAATGAGPLTLDEKLNTAAQKRVQEITSKFDHTRPDGTTFSSILNEQGITWTTTGENIAMGQTTPEAVMKDWMNSQGHRENILKSGFGRIGVGVYESGGKTYWVQLFVD